jgi:hypothetical protein
MFGKRTTKSGHNRSAFRSFIEHSSFCSGDVDRIAYRRLIDEATLVEVLGKIGCDRNCQTGLARAAGVGEGDQRRVWANQQG